MGGHCHIKKEFARYPKYQENYIKAFDRMLVRRKERERPTVWNSGEEVFAWWIGDDPNQISFDDYDEDWYIH